MQSQSCYRHSDVVYTANGNHLWIGDLLSAESSEDLRKKGIKTVLSCVGYNSVKYSEGIRHFVFELRDVKRENILQHFNKSNRYIKEGLKTGGVLVHCGAGVSRSATMVIAYLIKQQGMSFHQALKQCRSKRPKICPNLGFEMQLKFYQKNLTQSGGSTLLKQSLVKPRETSSKQIGLQTIYGARRNQSLACNTRKNNHNPFQSKVGFRLTTKEFRG